MPSLPSPIHPLDYKQNQQEIEETDNKKKEGIT